METVPKLRQQWIAWRSTCGRSVPMKVATLTRSITESKLAVVSGSVPTASMQASAPRPVRQLLDTVVDILVHEIERHRRRLSAAIASRSGTVSIAITRSAPSRKALRMANCADRAAAPDGDRVAAL